MSKTNSGWKQVHQITTHSDKNVFCKWNYSYVNCLHITNHLSLRWHLRLTADGVYSNCVTQSAFHILHIINASQSILKSVWFQRRCLKCMKFGMYYRLCFNKTDNKCLLTNSLPIAAILLRRYCQLCKFILLL